MGNSLAPHIERAQKTGVCSLCGKGLSEVPPQLIKLGGSLRTIDLSNNKLKSLPPVFGSLTSLKSLTLGFNSLGSLPPELSQLKKLEVLMLNKNFLRALPAGLFNNMSHLKTLSLASNHITVFPQGLELLKHLDVVDLSCNRIDSLPESVGELHVVELNLDRNQLSVLPASLKKCQRLKVLRVQENCLPIEALTPQLLKESQISLLSLEGNLFDVKELREAEGYEEYMARFTATKKKFT